VMREHEHRVMERRVDSPPPVPRLLGSQGPGWPPNMLRPISVAPIFASDSSTTGVLSLTSRPGRPCITSHRCPDGCGRRGAPRLSSHDVECCPLEVLEKVPQDLCRGEHEECLALFRREPEPDERAPNPDRGVARHGVEVHPFSPSEALPGDVEAFLREPPNCGVGSMHFLGAHAQGGEIVRESTRIDRGWKSGPARGRV